MARSISQRQLLVLENINFARAMARKFHGDRPNCGFELGDIESAAFMGLCISAKRYKASAGSSFKAFAYLRILGSMSDLLRNAGFTTRKEVRALADWLGQEKTPETMKWLLENSSVKLNTIAEIVHDAGIQLHTDEYGNLTDISYADPNDPETYLNRNFTLLKLKEFLKQLPKKEAKVIVLHYFGGLNFSQMRDQFDGATRSWLSRLHTQALGRLKTIIEAEGICGEELIREVSR